MLCMAGIAYAGDEGKWQEVEAYVEQSARVCSDRDKQLRLTERVAGCTQQACKQAKKLAAQTLGYDVSLRCKGAIRVGECHKGPAC
jgi:hypothetical protein